MTTWKRSGRTRAYKPATSEPTNTSSSTARSSEYLSQQISWRLVGRNRDSQARMIIDMEEKPFLLRH